MVELSWLFLPTHHNSPSFQCSQWLHPLVTIDDYRCRTPVIYSDNNLRAINFNDQLWALATTFDNNSSEDLLRWSTLVQLPLTTNIGIHLRWPTPKKTTSNDQLRRPPLLAANFDDHLKRPIPNINFVVHLQRRTLSTNLTNHILEEGKRKKEKVGGNLGWRKYF